MKTLGSSGCFDVKPNEVVPVGWEQYYSLPDFKKDGVGSGPAPNNIH